MLKEQQIIQQQYDFNDSCAHRIANVNAHGAVLVFSCLRQLEQRELRLAGEEKLHLRLKAPFWVVFVGHYQVPLWMCCEAPPVTQPGSILSTPGSPAPAFRWDSGFWATEMMPILKCHRLYNRLEMFGANGYMTWHDFCKGQGQTFGAWTRNSKLHWINLKTPHTTRNCRWGSPTARDEVWSRAAGARIEVDRILGKLSIPRKEKMKVGTENRSKIWQCDRHWERQVKSAIDETPKSNSKLFPEFGFFQDSPVICNKFI